MHSYKSLYELVYNFITNSLQLFKFFENYVNIVDIDLVSKQFNISKIYVLCIRCSNTAFLFLLKKLR